MSSLVPIWKKYSDSNS